MKLGVDLSVMDELQSLNPQYTYQGKPIEPFSFFAKHSGVSMVRLRLWNDPYDEQGRPYGGGTNDLPCFIRLAKKAIANGMEVMLDFHYSDFWVDPARQLCPKAWRNKTFDEVVQLLGDYTRDTLLAIKKEGIDLAAIQVGNEITHGAVWPYGETLNAFDPKIGGGFEGLCALLKAGCAACKEVYPNAKTLIHLEHSGSHEMQDGYFMLLEKFGVDYDVIGESYYPFWHGGFPDFEDNISKISKKFKKPIWVVEAGYEFTGCPNPDYVDEEADASIPTDILGNVPFPHTKQGQADYLAKLLEVCKKLGIEMVFYWEPTWIYLPNNGWADEAGQVYCGLKPEPPVNDWDRQCLFGFDGGANPGVDVFTQKFVDSIK